VASPTIASLITAAAERLYLAGVADSAADARREALQLWADLRATTPAAALLDRDRPVTSDVAAEFEGWIARRAAGEPRAYVSGLAGFRRLVLACDRRALIPRPETEGLIDLVLSRVRTGRAADIGTGTGCLALSLAIEAAFTEVLAVDSSAAALALARENARTVLGAPTHFLRGDLCEPLRPASLDALVGNPPYLTEREYASLDGAVRDWEPATALVSGADGLAATTRLLDDGRRVLRPGGWLALELDCTRAAETARRAVALGWQEVVIHHDLFGRERYLLARRSELS